MEEEERPPIDCPHLRAIRDEALRLEGGLLVASGHLAGLLGHPPESHAFGDALLAFAEEQGLDVEGDGLEGILFTRRTDH